jgi:hypothetical protein
MKNTPLQKLILKLADKKDEHEFNTEYDDGVRRGLALAIVNARELLEEEKQVIVDACDHNKGVNGWSDGLEYYKETYQNK